MIIMFPGQGSQKVGMGKDLYDNFESARNVFLEVDASVSFHLSDLIFNGAESDLKLTQNAQPALFAVSMAFMNVCKTDFGLDLAENATFFAGHSLGEYSAMCASGALSLSDSAKILKIRGEAMAKAYPVGGSMAAILGLEIDTVEEVVALVNDENIRSHNTHDVVQIANDNSGGQVIISGTDRSVDLAMQIASERAKRVIKLDVSGPFHCRLMQPAVDNLKQVLDEIEFSAPLRPVIANVSAKDETENFKELLLRQVTSRVRWRESLMFAQSLGVRRFVEVGAGRVLTGIAKKVVTSDDASFLSIDSIEAIKSCTSS